MKTWIAGRRGLRGTLVVGGPCEHIGAISGSCPNCQPGRYTATLLEQRDKLVKALRDANDYVVKAVNGASDLSNEQTLDEIAALTARVLAEVESNG